MQLLQAQLVDFAWSINGFGVLLILFTRWFANTRRTWAGVGCILMIIALGNAWVLVTAGLNPSQTLASIFGLAVLGSLASRFIGNWLTDGAT